MNQLSDRLNSLSPSETLAMSQKSNELKAQGIDVINMSVGEPDFNTPDHIKEAAKKAVDDNFSRYSPVPGYPALRDAIVAKLKKENGLDYTPAQILCSNGAKQSVCNVLMALIGPGDEVITPGFTYIATAETVALLGAKPVYVDVDAKTYNIDVTQLEAAITPRTKAIIPVSLYGQCADFDEINTIAAKYNLPVIEDAAQSFGATYKGRKSCNLTTIACTSFFPSKPLGCYGDGGAIFTNDEELAKVIRQIARHGQDRRYHHVRVGVNSRLDTIQAAILLPKLEILDDEVKHFLRLRKLTPQLLPSCTREAVLAHWQQPADGSWFCFR